MERLQQTNAELKEETDRSIALLQIKLPEMKEIEDKLMQVHEREEVVKAAINRASNATRAIESDLCCIVCLTLVQDAIVCVPCGHFYCKKCREGYHPFCQQCGQGKKVKVTMRLGLVDDIVGKVKYRKQAVSSVA